MILYIYIAPGQGQTAPRGESFDVNRNVLSRHGFVASLKKVSLKSDFIQFFSWFNTCTLYIAPGQGQTAARGQKFDVNRNVLSLQSFVASLKKKCLWSLLLYNFFHDLIHVYSPGAGADTPPPPGDKISMSTERPDHFTHLLQVSKTSLWSLILYSFFMI